MGPQYKITDINYPDEETTEPLDGVAHKVDLFPEEYEEIKALLVGQTVSLDDGNILIERVS